MISWIISTNVRLQIQAKTSFRDSKKAFNPIGYKIPLRKLATKLWHWSKGFLTGLTHVWVIVN